MGLGAGLDRCGKSGLPLGFDPRTVQPAASRMFNEILMNLIRKLLKKILTRSLDVAIYASTLP
jgi:hypothetical protein